ncbi:MAG: hypothetical protein LBG60_00210, partial [Bifidobacteriaceae bacterium]|nr:hypothetical protein [Bifidobacteriaceae bacterium]
RRELLGMRRVNPRHSARNARTRAALIRAEARKLRSLPVSDAALRIEAKRSEQETARQQAAQPARKLHSFAREPHQTGPRHDAPALGM